MSWRNMSTPPMANPVIATMVGIVCNILIFHTSTFFAQRVARALLDNRLTCSGGSFEKPFATLILPPSRPAAARFNRSSSFIIRSRSYFLYGYYMNNSTLLSYPVHSVTQGGGCGSGHGQGLDCRWSAACHRGSIPRCLLRYHWLVSRFAG